MLSAQDLTLAEVELKLLTIIKKSFKNREVTELMVILFSMSPVAPCVHMQGELICSGCFDLTLRSTEWVCQHLFVEKTNSSGSRRGISSSMSYRARDETIACSLAFLQSFFSWTIWGGFLLCSKVSASCAGAMCVQLPLVWLPDCPTRCLAPHCRLLWLWH